MRQYKTLDLHGLTEDEAISQLDRFIRENSQEEELMIIVGKGQGVIRKITTQYLEMGHYPWRYKIDHGKTNEGVLIVEMA